MLPPPPSYSIKPPIILISRSWAAIMFWNLEKEKIVVEFAMEKENRVYLKSPLTLENTGDMVSRLLCTNMVGWHYWGPVHAYPDIFEPATLQLFCWYGSSPQVSGESGIRIRNFLKVDFLNTLWIRNCLGAKSGYFFPVTKQDRVQFFTVNTLFKMATSTHALLPIFSEKSWALEWIQIRVGYVWTGKFDSNADTCGRGNVWIQREKAVD